MKLRIAALLGALAIACALPVHAAGQKAHRSRSKTSATHDAQKTDAKVSGTPLDADSLAIYKAVITRWMNDPKLTLNLSDQTIVLTPDHADCNGKASAFEPLGTEVHRIRPEDLTPLGPNKIRLVNAETQRKEISKSDPAKTFHKGSSVDDAVRNSFEKGLFILSEIRFDSRRQQAMVWHGFTCGSQCGSGGSDILEKANGVWSFKDVCSRFTSSAEQAEAEAEPELSASSRH